MKAEVKFTVRMNGGGTVCYDLDLYCHADRYNGLSHLVHLLTKEEYTLEGIELESISRPSEEILWKESK